MWKKINEQVLFVFLFAKRLSFLNFSEAMQAAIWEVSNKIGNNWATIYMKLPFMPDRTQEKRAEDIKSMITM